MSAYFTTKTFGFLKELAANNTRDWFQQNKERYEQAVREPALDFITDFTGTLHEISPHFVADPRKQGGSMFRIHRDTRFSSDKTPYKTTVGIQFRHEAAKSAHAPGFYLHIESNNCFCGAGVWRPPSDALTLLRAHIDDNPDQWKASVHGRPFSSTMALSGDSLKRPPKGFTKDHPLIDDLKRKDLVATSPMTHKTITSSSLLEDYGALCQDAAPLVKFICQALSLAY